LTSGLKIEHLIRIASEPGRTLSEVFSLLRRVPSKENFQSPEFNEACHYWA
jgi:hypothetical protein